MFPLANLFLIPEHGTCFSFCFLFLVFSNSSFSVIFPLPVSSIFNMHPDSEEFLYQDGYSAIYQQKPRNITAMEPLLSLAPSKSLLT